MYATEAPCAPPVAPSGAAPLGRRAGNAAPGAVAGALRLTGHLLRAWPGAEVAERSGGR